MTEWVTTKNEPPEIAGKFFVDKDGELHAYDGQSDNYLTITDCVSNENYEIYYPPGSIFESGAGTTPLIVNSILDKVSKYNYE